MRRTLALVFALVAATAIAQPAAWHASHPALPGELLLLGSIHVLRETNHPLPARIDDLFAESDQVVFELDLSNPSTLQAELASAAVLPPGQSLRSLLGPELYTSTNAKAAEHGVPLALLDGFQPWFVAISMTALGMQNLGYRSEYGVEHHVRGKALAEQKRILGLETLSDQIDVFSSLDASQQRLLLAQALDELDRGADLMYELVAAWERGELGELRDRLLEEFAAFPGLYARLIAERNVAWTERLVDLAGSDVRSLVVVGALHLVGDDSVTEQLRERGFAIRPIR